jgi:hypothetical protein
MYGPVRTFLAIFMDIYKDLCYDLLKNLGMLTLYQNSFQI